MSQGKQDQPDSRGSATESQPSPSQDGPTTITVSRDVFKRFRGPYFPPGVETSDARLTELLDSYVTVSDEDEVTNRYSDLFGRFAEKNVVLRLMWTLPWRKPANAYFKRGGLGEKVAKGPVHVHRIVAYLPLKDILQQIRFHFDGIMRREVTLYLPPFTPRTDAAELDALDSKALCPEVEISLFGSTVATLSFKHGDDFAYMQSANRFTVEQFYKLLWEHFKAGALPLTDERSVWEWLVTLDGTCPNLGKEAQGIFNEIWARFGSFEWNRIAPRYDELVRKSGTLPYFDQYFDEERENLVAAIGAWEAPRRVNFIDFGCGTGSLLASVAQWLKKADQVTKRGSGKSGGDHSKLMPVILGMDDSESMLAVSRRKRDDDATGWGRSVALIKQDIGKLNGFLRDGKLGPPNQANSKEIARIDRDVFNGSFHLAWAANVLPNVPRNAYRSFFDALYNALGIGDRLFVSTYNVQSREVFEKNAHAVYGHVTDFTGPIPEGRFDDERYTYMNFSKKFFSHWSTEDELAHALTQSGFRLIHREYKGRLGAYALGEKE
jgi:SAM-dependent methyltransferase